MLPYNVSVLNCDHTIETLQNKLGRRLLCDLCMTTNN